MKFLSASSLLVGACLFSSSGIASASLQRHVKRSYNSDPITTCKNSGTAALTFDDGPYIWNKDVVKALNGAGVKGTFFLNGQNWDCIYDQAESIQAAFKDGHMFGSHTWTHQDITVINKTVLTEQIKLVETAFQKILGVKPHFFRPPYGSYNAESLEVLKGLGYYVVTWDTDSGDSDGEPVSFSESVYRTVEKSYPKPHIILNHETYKTTVFDVLPYALKTLKKYKLQTVGQCLGIAESKWYTKVGEPGKRDSTWTCNGTPEPQNNIPGTGDD